MLNDSFRIRYRAIPIATSEQIDSFAPTNLHNHNEFEILLILSGSCTVRIANMEYFAKKGDMIFINPLEIHEITVNTDAPYHHKCMCFDISVIMNNRLGENLRNECMCINHHIKSDSVHSGYLADLFEKVFDVFCHDEKTMAMDISAYITLIFSYLVKNSLSDTKTLNPAGTRFCADVTEYIKQHYSENITSKKAADACFLNPSYFCRKFKENFGVSFSSYLNMYRISIAKSMLEEESLSIGTISEMCGFDTPTYFSRCFKQQVGLLPAEYKKGKRGL